MSLPLSPLLYMEYFLILSFIISFAIIAYVYIGYPCLLVFLALFKRSKRITGSLEPSVTLIISAFNEEKCIREKLENSLTIDYPKDKFEIIVLSDASTDSTDKIVIEFENQGVRKHLPQSARRVSSACHVYGA